MGYVSESQETQRRIATGEMGARTVRVYGLSATDSVCVSGACGTPALEVGGVVAEKGYGVQDGGSGRSGRGFCYRCVLRLRTPFHLLRTRFHLRTPDDPESNHVWCSIGSKINAQYVGCHAAKAFENVLVIDDDCKLPEGFPVVSDRFTESVGCIGYTIKSGIWGREEDVVSAICLFHPSPSSLRLLLGIGCLLLHSHVMDTY